jgi:tRNA(fMet)-specific endonuclease VapC
MTALLDTDTLSEIFRGKNPTVMARASAYARSHQRFRISTITEVEISRGWYHSDKPDRALAFRAWLAARCDCIGLGSEVGWLAGEIAGVLGRTGNEVGLADVCIAATALHHGLVLVTGNIRHHERVRAAGFPLELDNWREPAPP